jgi:hypothetical protein
MIEGTMLLKITGNKVIGFDWFGIKTLSGRKPALLLMKYNITLAAVATAEAASA